MESVAAANVVSNYTAVMRSTWSVLVCGLERCFIEIGTRILLLIIRIDGFYSSLD